MAINEERIKKIIEQALLDKKEVVHMLGNKLVLTDYTDIDYPVYYEIKLERY